MTHGRRWTAPALALLAGAARAAAAAGLAVIPRDGIVAVETARAVAGGDPAAAFAGRSHPLFSLLAGLAGGTETAAVAVAVLAGALGAPAVLRLGAALHSRAAGVAAALCYAAAPALVRHGSMPLAEAVYVPLLLWAAERGLAARESPRAALAAGALAGLAYLARPEGLLLPLVLVPALLLCRRPKAAGLLLAAFLLLGGSYAGWLSAEAGRPVLSRKKPALRFLHAEEGFDEHIAEKSRRTGLPRPGVPGAAAETFRTLGEATSWVFLVLLVPGAIFVLRRGERAPAAILLALLAADLLLHFRLCHLHGYLGRRHLLAAAALCLPFAGGAALLLGRRRALVAAGVLAAALAALAVRPDDREKLPLKQAGRLIRAVAGPGERVASWLTPRVAYYAEGTDVPLHRLAPEDLAATLRASDWLALVPGRLPEETRERLARATGGPPDLVAGEGEWRVEVHRLR